MKNKLSIITICYNSCEDLRKTFDSVFSQTCKEFEYIVIDGGSTDGSADLIKANADKIDYWVSEPDKGIYNAMNKGVAHAHGEYCLFLNGGDTLYEKESIEKILPQLTGEKIVYARVKKGDKISKYIPEMSFIELCYPGVCHQGFFINTELMRKIPYDESLKLVSDWKFLLEALIVNNVSYKGVDMVVCNFDMGGASTSNQELLYKECEMVRSKLFPARVLSDYDLCQRNVDGWLYWELMKSTERKRFYSMIIRCLKFFAKINRLPQWVREYPLSLDEKLK